MSSPEAPRPSGIPHAIAAYLTWGLLPLYLRLMHDMPPLEFVGWRTLFALPVCLAIVFATRQTGALVSAITNKRMLALLTLSALLIGSNWTIYVAAIQYGYVFAASLGYYILPLLNVLIGTLFLGEKLSAKRWVAVALASAGVAVLAAGAWQTLGVSLALAATFSAYGVLRKTMDVGALPGLTLPAFDWGFVQLAQPTPVDGGLLMVITFENLSGGMARQPLWPF